MNCVRTRGEEPPRLYGVINGLLRMRNGLRRSQELDDLVDVLASSIGALTNPRTNCPHRRRSRRRSLAARDRRQLPEDRPRTRRGQTRPRRTRHPHDERLRFPPQPGQPDDVTPDGRQMPRNAAPPPLLEHRLRGGRGHHDETAEHDGTQQRVPKFAMTYCHRSAPSV